MKLRNSIMMALGFAGAVIAANPAMAEPFEGPYSGAAAGWSRSEIASNTADGRVIDAEVARDALVLAGHAGYNYKLADKLVLGAEAGFSATVDDRIRAASAGDDLTIDPRYSFDISARAGYLVNDKTLLYVRGGYENERVRASLDDGTTTVRVSDNLDGFSVGGGAEYALTSNIVVRAEYRYAEFDTDGGDYRRHRGLIGLSYHF